MDPIPRVDTAAGVAGGHEAVAETGGRRNNCDVIWDWSCQAISFVFLHRLQARGGRPDPDGRHDVPAVFDGVSPSRRTAVPLKLKSVERREMDALWIRYEVIRPPLDADKLVHGTAKEKQHEPPKR
jgi:hypothetical protein